MERELQSLRKMLVERMPQLTVGDLQVTGGVTVQETLAAATLREGGQSLGEVPGQGRLPAKGQLPTEGQVTLSPRH